MIAFFSTDGGTFFSNSNHELAYSKIGNNLGNGLFHRALFDVFDSKPKIMVNTGTNVDWINENCNSLVIPAANQINPNWDLTDWYKFILNIKIPIYCLGLGAQSDNRSNAKLELKEGTLNFLKILAEKCNNISVRGSYTQEVLNQLNIKNTLVTGCPSQLLNHHLQLIFHLKNCLFLRMKY